MFQWLKRKLQLKAVELQRQDIQRFLALLKGMTDHKMGMVVAVATGIRLRMEEHGHDIEAEMEAVNSATAEQCGQVMMKVPLEDRVALR